MRTIAKTLVWLIPVGLLAAAPPAAVWAHAELTKSSPADGATLTASPSLIQASFSEELKSSGTYLRLYDAHNKLLGSGGLDPKVSSHRVAKLTPPRLSSGSYQVRWRAVAADDNAVTQGTFRFAIRAAAMAPAATPMASVPPLRLIAPVNQGRVKNPVGVVIDTPGDMAKLTVGG